MRSGEWAGAVGRSKFICERGCGLGRGTGVGVGMGVGLGAGSGVDRK